MERQEFLRLLGTASIAVCAGCSLESCSNDSGDAVPAAPTGVDFTLDLSMTANAILTSDGGFLYKSGIIVVCLNATAKTYVAVSQACTHQGTTVSFQSSSSQFVCPAHGSRFSSSGTVVQGPAASSLHQYNTSLTGTNLRVFS